MTTGIDQEFIILRARAEIELQLLERGYAFGPEDELRVSSREWRSLARDCGEGLDRPLKTTEVRDDLYAVLMDWPRDGEKNDFPSHAPELATCAQFHKYLATIQRSLSSS